jgi:hypothetical protein
MVGFAKSFLGNIDLLMCIYFLIPPLQERIADAKGKTGHRKTKTSWMTLGMR